jgi:hypothetical protein
VAGPQRIFTAFPVRPWAGTGMQPFLLSQRRIACQEEKKRIAAADSSFVPACLPAWSDLANILIWYQKPFQNRRFESLEPRFGGKKCTSKVKNHPFFMPFLM